MTAVSDEGMWLLNDPPREHLKEKYKFDLTDAWLKNAMLASVRLNSGGSGGFVSPEGLLVTNHHVAADSRAEAQQGGRGHAARRLLRRDARQGTQVPGPRSQRAARDHRRDEGGERGGEAGDEAGRGVRGAAGGDGARSKRNRSTRPACARMSSRSTTAGCITSTATRSTPTCGSSSPGEGNRQFRRRRGQLRVPAHEPRCRVLPRLRERRTREDAALLQVERNRADRRTTSSSSPGTPARRSGSKRWHASSTAATSRCRTRWPALRTLEAALTQYSEQSPEKTAPGRHRPAQRRQRPQGVQRPIPGAARSQDHGAEEDSERQLLFGAAETWPRECAKAPRTRIADAHDDAARRPRNHRADAGEIRASFEKPYATARNRARLLLAAVRLRAALRPHGGRVAEEVVRPAARIPRLEPRIAQVRSVQPGADLPRPGTSEAHQRRSRSWRSNSAASTRW